jgi:hypothetical protein
MDRPNRSVGTVMHSAYPPRPAPTDGRNDRNNGRRGGGLRPGLGAVAGLAGSSLLAGLGGVAQLMRLKISQPASAQLLTTMALAAVLLGGVSVFGRRAGGPA